MRVHANQPVNSLKGGSGLLTANLVLGLIFTTLLTHLPVAYTVFYHTLTGAPAAVEGNMDLKGSSPEGTIILDGNWEFYWKRLIAAEPKPDCRPDLFIKVPDYWSKYKIGGKWLCADGFASYRLTLDGLEYDKPVTVYIPDFGSAYRAYIDGILTAESGIVSKDIDRIHTVPKAVLYPVTLSPGQAHEIVIEVATTRFSGLYMAPVLRDYDQVIRENGNRTGARFILFGIVLFSFFALVVMYMLPLHKRTRSAWIPPMALLIFLRLMLTTEFYSYWQEKVFFGLSYEAVNELMFLVTFIIKYLMLFMMQDIFGVVPHRREKLGFLIYYVVLYFLFLLTPQGFYNRHLTILLPVATFALEFHCFFKIYRHRRCLKKSSVPIYWGTVLAISGLIIDCYYVNGNIYFNMSLALLILLSAFMALLSLTYALRIALSYNEYALSSLQLSQMKDQIAMQQEYYDALSEQINEIRKIKHDIRHFVGAIRRLADDGRYDELKRFLNEFEEMADTDPLPVFCENAVANSILGYYSLKAKAAGIMFHCTCSIQKQLPLGDSDLCIILGNAVENAIEACKKLDDPKMRFVSVEAGTINGLFLIKVGNSYDGCLNVQNGEFITTKSESSHGLGIKNIRRVVDANKGFLKIEHDKKTFTLMTAFPANSDRKENLCDNENKPPHK